MKALVSADLHSSDRAAKTIGHGLAAGDFDCHLCLGDIITFRPMGYLEDLFSDPPVPTYTVPLATTGEERTTPGVERGCPLKLRGVKDREGRFALANTRLLLEK